MRLRRQGQTFEEIGEQLGVTRQRAHQIYWQTLREIPAQQVAEYRAEQAERLDELLRKAHEVLQRRHITVSNGQVVRLDGQPVEDDGPTLMAIKTILAIEERRAKLFGLDTPVKQQVEVDGGVRYEIVGVDLSQLQ
ncbi:sigma factor-like helix-turn-helix DNA-binding protein [Thermoactinospora rubra]|uniref:sigma factor-like helix-turn-helix DNA-binding protein n=1 Tax=Thermoactinospora rubra TaxID=1088767 RepID=UPI000A1224E1|nr:sigma factor-like helix-turn-helix DNA-binding protein [Thermoactinospora rubra]